MYYMCEYEYRVAYLLAVDVDKVLNDCALNSVIALERQEPEAFEIKEMKKLLADLICE